MTHVSISATIDPRGARLLAEVQSTLYCENVSEIFRRSILACRFFEPASESTNEVHVSKTRSDVVALGAKQIVVTLPAEVHVLLEEQMRSTGSTLEEILVRCLCTFIQLTRKSTELAEKMAQDEEYNPTPQEVMMSLLSS